MKSLVISVIIVTYNSENYIADCIKSVLKYSHKCLAEIILVDNNSEDNTLTILNKFKDHINILTNDKNYGFARACNRGIQASTGDYIMILNPDTKFKNDVLNYFISFIDNNRYNNVWCVGAQLFDDYEKATKSHGNFPNILDVFLEQIGIKWLILRIIPKSYIAKKRLHLRNTFVHYVLGSSMFIRKNVFNEIGLFDERFFLNFEEAELSWRAKKAGYKSMILPEAKILHYAGKSFPDKKNYLSHLWLGQLLFFKLTKNRFIFLIAKILHLFGSAIRLIIRFDNFYVLHLKKIKSI
ncbi:MAG: glycosyltransferase family 2 protein [Ignavibacteriales bacterium]|nr:glycosyltransferase family 2 protein [Ignavibacteriales bacterium]